MDMGAWPVLAHFVRSWPFLSGIWPVLSDLSGSWPAHPHDRLKCNHQFLVCPRCMGHKIPFLSASPAVHFSGLRVLTHIFLSSFSFLKAAHLPWPERSPRPPRVERGAVCPPRRMKPNCQRTNYRIYPLFAIDKATYSRRSGLPENKLGAYITSERMIKILGPHRAGPILDGQGDCFWRNRPVFTAPKQHAAQIRDCLVVDQIFRTERACYVEGNSFRLPEKGNSFRLLEKGNSFRLPEKGNSFRLPEKGAQAQCIRFSAVRLGPCPETVPAWRCAPAPRVARPRQRLTYRI